MTMKNFIELHGAEENQPMIVDVAFIRMIYPRAAITNPKANIDDNCQTIVRFDDGYNFEAREPYELVRAMVVKAVGGEVETELKGDDVD